MIFLHFFHLQRLFPLLVCGEVKVFDFNGKNSYVKVFDFNGKILMYGLHHLSVRILTDFGLIRGQSDTQGSMGRDPPRGLGL